MSKEVIISHLKESLRLEIKSALLAADPGFLAREAACLCQIISAEAVWQNSSAILFYASIHQEVNIWPLVETSLQKGAAVCLPRYIPQKDFYEAALLRNTDTDLVSGHFGVREPGPDCPTFPLNRLDFILVPGVAFDASGYRLGRGRGYYDRLLPLTRGILCGVAYEQQIRSKIPVEPHDIRVDYVATPQRWIVAGPRAAC